MQRIKPLPGKEAHLCMAAAHRREELLRDAVPEQAVDAAVLVLLSPVNAGLTREELMQWPVLLIRRSAYNGVHSGQIAFPGGKREKEDASLWAAACREAREEMGIAEAHVVPVCPLSEIYVGASNFLVHPFVAVKRVPLAYCPSPREVAGYRELPLGLFDPARAASRPVSRSGSCGAVPSWECDEGLVWGATAMMLAELHTLVGEGGLVPACSDASTNATG